LSEFPGTVIQATLFSGQAVRIHQGVFMSNLISPEECIASLGEENICIIDCRFELSDPAKGKSLYYESHLPGAVYVSLNEDLSAPVGLHGGRHPLPPLEYLAFLFGKLGIVRNRTRIIAYDDSGGPFAARLWWMLRYCGHDAVQVIDGGFSAYVYAGGSLTTDVPLCVPVPFVPEVRKEMYARQAEIETARNAGALIDCRAPERFRGEYETIDVKAGHIPGAVNIHWMGNLDSRNRMLPAESLRERFESLPSQPIMYSGSGGTACMNVIAYEEAGLGLAKLYPGSWSDWISYPGNAVETGG